MTPMMNAAHLDQLDAAQLRQMLINEAALVQSQAAVIEANNRALALRDIKIQKLTFEIAQLRRARFGARTEQLSSEQAELFEESLQTDVAAAQTEIDHIATQPAEPAAPLPRRTPLPAHLPRTEIHHEPQSTRCPCGCQMKRIGEDVAEKLDYTPGVFTVERHVRGKWVCAQCETLTQAPVPAHVIDKGIPTARL
jgi:hypothetical protein